MHLSRQEIEEVIKNLPNKDRKQIDIVASRLAAGLSSVTSEDLIQEVYAQLLAEQRPCPRNVPITVVIIMDMKSEASKHRAREKNGAVNHLHSVTTLPPEHEEGDVAEQVCVITPERILAGKQEMDDIRAKVAGDQDTEELVEAYALGLRGRDAAEFLGWDMNKCEAARKRLTRRLDN